MYIGTSDSDAAGGGGGGGGGGGTDCRFTAFVVTGAGGLTVEVDPPGRDWASGFGTAAGRGF